MPFSELVDRNNILKPNKDLAKIFLQKDIDTTQTSVFTCQAGVTACIAELALTILGGEKTVLYDKSWQEYVSKTPN